MTTILGFNTTSLMFQGHPLSEAEDDLVYFSAEGVLAVGGSGTSKALTKVYSELLGLPLDNGAFTISRSLDTVSMANSAPAGETHFGTLVLDASGHFSPVAPGLYYFGYTGFEWLEVATNTLYIKPGGGAAKAGDIITSDSGIGIDVYLYDSYLGDVKKLMSEYDNLAGDVTGLLNNTVVAKIHGDIVDTDAPTTGDVFQWNGSEWHQQPISKVRAHLSTDFAVAPSTWKKVPFDTEDYDTLSEYDPSANYRFTCNEAGYYKVDAAVKWEFSAQGDQILIAIRRNGSIVAGCERYVRYGVYNSQQVNDVIYLTASQYLEIFVYTSSNSANLIASEGSSHFTVHRVL